jgi:hypothetical protein
VSAAADPLVGNLTPVENQPLNRAANTADGSEREQTETTTLEVLLDSIARFICRFVSLSPSQTAVLALWVVHTHVFQASECTPYLAITSAEKESGKTRLLEVLETLVARPWFTASVTTAVLPRRIEAVRPTLLLDESDALFRGNKERSETLRGVLNSGYRRTGSFSCCIRSATDFSTRDFSTFCPKAIAGIGNLPDTVAGRSIPIRLKRRAPFDQVENWRQTDSSTQGEARRLKGQLQALAPRLIPSLQASHPCFPDELTDRQQDVSAPLLAISELSGERWQRTARIAILDLCTSAWRSDDSVGIQLLRDIHGIFELRPQVDRLPSVTLLAALTALETSPWMEFSHGKALTLRKLAELLQPYDISPHTIRVGDSTPKGYLRDDFQDVWTRFRISSLQNATAPPGSVHAETAPV